MNNEVAPTSMLVPIQWETKHFWKDTPAFVSRYGSQGQWGDQVAAEAKDRGCRCSRESSERTAGQSEWGKTFEQARLD